MKHKFYLLPFIIISTASLKAQHNINPIDVTFKVDNLQKVSEQGLKFSIRFKNDSTAAVEIINPLDLLVISLTNQSGKNIFIPKPYKFMVNSKAAVKHTDRSVVIGKVTSNEKVVKGPIDDAGTISIPANGVYEIFLSINHVLKPDATGPYTEEEETVLAIGKYMLSIYVSIAQKASKNFKGTMPHRAFSAIQAEVNYGK